MPSDDYADLIDYADKLHPTPSQEKADAAPRQDVPRPGDPGFWQKAASYMASHGKAFGKGVLQGGALGGEDKLAGLGSMLMGDGYQAGADYAKQFYKPEPGTEATQLAGRLVGGAPAMYATGAGAAGIMGRAAPLASAATQARSAGMLSAMTAGGLAGLGGSEAPTVGGQLADGAMGANLGAGVQHVADVAPGVLAAAKGRMMSLAGKGAQMPPTRVRGGGRESRPDGPRGAPRLRQSPWHEERAGEGAREDRVTGAHG